jgi:hypothetical protein
MIHPCPTKSLCVDPQFPLANLTSEGPDIDLYLSSFFGTNTQTPPNLGFCSTNPTDPQFCHSNNPLAASICANNQYYAQYVSDWNLQCKQTPAPTGPPPSPPPPGYPYTPPVKPPPTTNPSTPQVFYNAQQQCSYTCPDSKLFTWTIGAGYINGPDQGNVDRQAKQLACQKANANALCVIGSFPSSGCPGQPYSGSITFTGPNTPITFYLSSGAVPPGLVFSQSTDGKTAMLTGTPTTAGNYTFTIQAVDSIGNVTNKQFTIAVIGISNPSPPSPIEHSPYSYQFNAAGGIPPYTFTLLSGSIAGLSLSSSGLYSGTMPYKTATANPVTLAIQVTDSQGQSCTQNVSILPKLAHGPDWTQLVWTVTPNITPPDTTGSGSGSGNTHSGTLQRITPSGSFEPTELFVQTNHLPWDNSPFTCVVELTVSTNTTFNAFFFPLKYNGGSGTTLLNSSATPPGGTIIGGGGPFINFWEVFFSLTAADVGNHWAYLNPYSAAGLCSYSMIIYNQ